MNALRVAERGSSVQPAVPALLGVLFWSTHAIAANAALDDLSWQAVLVLQFSACTITLLAVRTVQQRRFSPSAPRPVISRKSTAGGAVVGIVGLGGTLTLQYVGFAYAPLVEANVISYGWPMFAAVYSFSVIRTRTTTAGLAFAFLGFCGVLLIFSSQGGVSGDGNLLGYAAALLSAVCMTFFTFGVVRSRAPQLDILLWGASAGLAFSALLTVTSDTRWALSPAVFAALYVGAGSVAGGYMLWSWGMVLSEGRLAPLGYAIPLLSTLILLLTGASFTARSASGALLVLICSVGVLGAERLWGADAQGPVRSPT
ncbi:DMT family transporter [Streptomyces sp. 184]|uniref:DMT family transporter n=1 Tax=Streptomyces sp. 184 TaxID=1827526 RepID=UPI0038918C21